MLENGTDEGRKTAREELKAMATAADLYNTASKALNETVFQLMETSAYEDARNDEDPALMETVKTAVQVLDDCARAAKR